MEAILHNAVVAEDEITIRTALYDLLEKGPLLIRVHNFLRQEALYSEWLDRLLKQCEDLWFLSFKYTQPREVVCAFEYDYFIRHTEASQERNATVGLLESVIDECLLIRYHGIYGISQRRDTGPYGKDVFLTLRPFQALEGSFTQGETNALPFDDGLLNPPLTRVVEWTSFHVKMRRIAFHILKEVILIMALFLEQQSSPIKRRTLLTPLSRALDIYVTHLSTRIWRSASNELVSLADVERDLSHSATEELAERKHLFFMPPPEFGATLLGQGMEHRFLLTGDTAETEWRDLIENQVAFVESGWNLMNECLFLDNFLHISSDRALTVPRTGLYDFIYGGTSDEQHAFHTRVSYMWQK